LNNLNASKTFKNECDILNLKDEDSPSFLFANKLMDKENSEDLSDENKELIIIYKESPDNYYT
jgi:hypothetical protein